jgi:hypothetical protein
VRKETTILNDGVIRASQAIHQETALVAGDEAAAPQTEVR